MHPSSHVTAAVMQPLMANAMAQGRQEKKLGTGPFDISLQGRLLVWIAEPPPKFRMSAPHSVRPPAQIDDPAKLLPDFLKAQDGWQSLILESAVLDLEKIKVGARFSPFRARLAAVFPWMMAHQRRHCAKLKMSRSNWPKIVKFILYELKLSTIADNESCSLQPTHTFRPY
jgi:hypothetical protein